MRAVDDRLRRRSRRLRASSPGSATAIATATTCAGERRRRSRRRRSASRTRGDVRGRVCAATRACRRREVTNSSAASTRSKRSSRRADSVGEGARDAAEASEAAGDEQSAAAADVRRRDAQPPRGALAEPSAGVVEPAGPERRRDRRRAPSPEWDGQRDGVVATGKGVIASSGLDDAEHRRAGRRPPRSATSTATREAATRGAGSAVPRGGSLGRALRRATPPPPVRSGVR